MFTPRAAVEDELKAAKALRTTDPKKAADLVKYGQQLVALAEHGDLESLRVHFLSYKKRIMYWFVVKAFETALLSGHFHIAEHMLSNGVDLRHNQWKELLIGCIQLAIDDELAQDVTTFLVNSHIDINHQRRKDYFTALHVACTREFPRTVNTLIDLGADVNAVAANDMMPLLIMHNKLQTRDTVDTAREREMLQAMFVTLQARGAKLTWRRDHLRPERARRTPVAVTNASMSCGDEEDGDGGQCFETEDSYLFDTSVANTLDNGYDSY